MSDRKRYSAIYFKKTAKIARSFFKDDVVTIQFFQWQNNLVLAGMKQVLELLSLETDVTKYTIRHKNDGDIINSKDIVLELVGPYYEFGEYEGIIDGILARATSVATNARDIMEAANGKDVIFMADRADFYLNQELDGYAASLVNMKTQVTEAHIASHDGKAIGTIPHVLIQMNKGDIVKTLRQYKEVFGTPLIALVDFNNDVISDSLKALKEFKEELVAVRVDTSSKVSDAYFKNNEEFGVTPNLIFALRKALDKNDGSHVKIIVSGGFDAKKIALFEKEQAPVDIYGSGKALLNIFANFTGDAVKFNGEKIAKVGRAYRDIN